MAYIKLIMITLIFGWDHLICCFVNLKEKEKKRKGKAMFSVEWEGNISTTKCQPFHLMGIDTHFISYAILNGRHFLWLSICYNVYRTLSEGVDSKIKGFTPLYLCQCNPLLIKEARATLRELPP